VNIKKPKTPRFTHTANTKHGMGDFYGSGIKNKIARIREGFNENTTNRKLGKPPKSLA